MKKIALLLVGFTITSTAELNSMEKNSNKEMHTFLAGLAKLSKDAEKFGYEIALEEIKKSSWCYEMLQDYKSEDFESFKNYTHKINNDLTAEDFSNSFKTVEKSISKYITKTNPYLK
ncbi:MAG: hypothetical protein ACXWL5_04130 [Candidatus Chromulinivorax sp.]